MKKNGLLILVMFIAVIDIKAQLSGFCEDYCDVTKKINLSGNEEISKKVDNGRIILEVIQRRFPSKNDWLNEVTKPITQYGNKNAPVGINTTEQWNSLHDVNSTSDICGPHCRTHWDS